MDILYCHTVDLNPWPVATCAAHNYRPREWSPKSDTDERTDRNIRSTGPHWDPLDPILGDKYTPTLDPTLEINKNKKTEKGPWTTVRLDGRTYGRTELLYCYSGYFNPWPAVACNAHNYRPHARFTKKGRGWPGIETERWTYKLDWTPLGSFGPQCGDKYIAMLDSHTGNWYNKKFSKGPRKNVRTVKHIILPPRGFGPVACGRMRCTQL